jgi:hypothetical protein
LAFARLAHHGGQVTLPAALIFRGIEPVEIGSGTGGAAVQEWLVVLLS